MLGSLILYLRGMRIMMFQLSGFDYKSRNPEPKTQTPKTPNPTRDCVFVLSHLRLSANCFAYFRVRFMIVAEKAMVVSGRYEGWE